MEKKITTEDRISRLFDQFIKECSGEESNNEPLELIEDLTHEAVLTEE